MSKIWSNGKAVNKEGWVWIVLPNSMVYEYTLLFRTRSKEVTRVFKMTYANAEEEVSNYLTTNTGQPA